MPKDSFPWFDLPSQQTQNAQLSYLDWYETTIPKSYTVPDHVRLIAEHLDAVESGEIDRLAIHMPPRHGKSETVTVRYPLRRLLGDPTRNVLVTGYNSQFARRFGRRTRNMAVERGIVAPDKTASDEWVTRQGGIYMSRGVGSPPTGVGFDTIVIDDPVKNREEAESEVYREKAWDWYSNDIYSRLEPGGSIVMVATLWHEDDVCARAVASEPGRWTVLKLPAIKDGEALWPERYGVEQLERIKSVMGAYSFEALYQQQPTPAEGSLFKREWFNVGEIPPCGTWVRYWDLAVSTKTTGDWTVGALCAVAPDHSFYVKDIVRFRAEWPDACQMIAETAVADLAECRSRGSRYEVGVDSRMSQQGFLQDLFRKGIFERVPLHPDRDRGDKKERASGWAARAGAGKLTIAFNPAWNQTFISECMAFGSGGEAHDDQVDAVSGAFSLLWRLRGQHTPPKPPIEPNTYEFYDKLAKQAKRQAHR